MITSALFAIALHALTAGTPQAGVPPTGTPPSPRPSGGIRLEAENGQLSGPRVAAETPGYSGTGYVTDLTAEGARVTWRFTASDGLYQLRMRFRTPQGEKGCEISVNGKRINSQLPARTAWDTANLGKIELTGGDNTVTVERGWGYYDIDFVEMSPTRPTPPPKRVPPTLTTPNASREARALMEYLSSIYGKYTLSGQYGLDEMNAVRRRLGVFPAIQGADLMDYSPSREAFGTRPKNLTESWIQSSRDGTILALSWHWNAPKDLLDRMEKNERGEEVNKRWYKGFYTNATTFDVAKAMANPQSEDYRLLVRDIDHIAVELKKLADAGIPVLWRPLHEADGRWFWWGAKGPEACIKLWRMMHQRLVGHHKLNNLIWVWNAAPAEWYPGDDTVDIMSIDAYPSDRTDPLSAAWDDLLARFDGRKMIGLAEFPGPSDVDRMHRFGARWLFSVSWTGDLGPSGSPEELVKRSYLSPRTIVASELPNPRPWVRRPAR